MSTESVEGEGRAAQTRDQKLKAIADLPRSSVVGGEAASSLREASLARVLGREEDKCWTGLKLGVGLVVVLVARRLRVEARGLPRSPR